MTSTASTSAKPALQQGVALLVDGHVQLVVGQAALAEEVVADEVAAARRQQRADLRVQRRRVVLVAQLVHGLVRDDDVERAQAVAPGRLAEAAFDEGDARGAFAQALRGELVHRRREVERDVVQVGQRAQQVVGEKARARAEFQHARAVAADLAREGVEEFGPRRPPRQRGLGPGAGVGHQAQVDRAGDVDGHGRASLVEERTSVPASA